MKKSTARPLDAQIPAKIVPAKITQSASSGQEVYLLNVKNGDAWFPMTNAEAREVGQWLNGKRDKCPNQVLVQQFIRAFVARKSEWETTLKANTTKTHQMITPDDDAASGPRHTHIDIYTACFPQLIWKKFIGSAFGAYRPHQSEHDGVAKVIAIHPSLLPEFWTEPSLFDGVTQQEYEASGVKGFAHTADIYTSDELPIDSVFLIGGPPVSLVLRAMIPDGTRSCPAPLSAERLIDEPVTFKVLQLVPAEADTQDAQKTIVQVTNTDVPAVSHLQELAQKWLFGGMHCKVHISSIRACDREPYITKSFDSTGWYLPRRKTDAEDSDMVIEGEDIYLPWLRVHKDGTPPQVELLERLEQFVEKHRNKWEVYIFLQINGGTINQVAAGATER